jgi:hypothetical protein
MFGLLDWRAILDQRRADRGRRSDQEDRHPGEDYNDYQDRNLDEPGKPDPGTAMPFEFRIYCRHIRLAG